ncbi:GL18258 [Drosophila persimilis]|uniref:GL18258 n=1 Tax=Drosophila persimilis TaxID=7234 RepID=B4H4R9_DROPE|nr:GL18258 [Drosophila persimilis]
MYGSDSLHGRWVYFCGPGKHVLVGKQTTCSVLARISSMGWKSGWASIGLEPMPLQTSSYAQGMAATHLALGIICAFQTVLDEAAHVIATETQEVAIPLGYGH